MLQQILCVPGKLYVSIYKLPQLFNPIASWSFECNSLWPIYQDIVRCSTHDAFIVNLFLSGHLLWNNTKNDHVTATLEFQNLMKIFPQRSPLSNLPRDSRP